ncbi:hypothetical protein [Lewinella sp. W8]|uniref:hypothetical protein n=1 Tax=Lewinella sp. W8 TaxID=2528208 RepID=UPI001067F68E|nr:hypothetical protein [Lewinella sp. W8]MTB52865.1 hypothetical protein [Lewinella sp. W8]
MRSPTPNFFRLNYGHGRSHSAMIVYLVERWNYGDPTPLTDFLVGLNVHPPTAQQLTAKLEYNNIDLAIFEGAPEKKNLYLLLEMKVDDWQGWKPLSKKQKNDFEKVSKSPRKDLFGPQIIEGKKRLIQTEYYTLKEELYEMEQATRPTCLLITLGTGEFYEDFTSRGNIWQQVGLEKVVEAVKKIEQTDELLRQWQDALVAELELRQSCWTANEEKAVASQGNRARLLPLMRLGQLRSTLIDNYPEEIAGYQPSVYPHGSNDAILNFFLPPDWRSGGFRYVEINRNGLLNFKIYFKKGNSTEDKQKLTEAFREDLERVFDKLILPRKNGYKKSKTVASLEIGLVKDTMSPVAGQTPESVAATVAKFLHNAKSIVLVNTSHVE